MPWSFSHFIKCLKSSGILQNAWIMKFPVTYTYVIIYNKCGYHSSSWFKWVEMVKPQRRKGDVLYSEVAEFWEKTSLQLHFLYFEQICATWVIWVIKRNELYRVPYNMIYFYSLFLIVYFYSLFLIVYFYSLFL